MQFIKLTDLLDWLLSGDPDDVFELSDGHFLMVEANYEVMADGSINLGMPKAVGQALAWATITRLIMCPFVKCSY